MLIFVDKTKSFIRKNSYVLLYWGDTFQLFMWTTFQLLFTYIDFSDGQQTQGEANLKQTLQELQGTSNNTPRVSYEELERTKLEIERELHEIKTKGLERIFDNQQKAVADFEKNYTKSSTLPIKILCIRGESFVSNRPENWGAVISTKCKKTVVLGNPSNNGLIKNRYNANKNPDETESDFIERYMEDMKTVQGKIKKSSELYLHDEINLRYRMLFVDNYLYLSKFKEEKTASQAEVIKIPKGYALYSVCEDHFNQILTNSRKE